MFDFAEKNLAAKTFLFLFQTRLHVKLFYTLADVTWSRDTIFFSSGRAFDES